MSWYLPLHLKYIWSFIYSFILTASVFFTGESFTLYNSHISSSLFRSHIPTHKLLLILIYFRLLFSEFRRASEQMAGHPRCPGFLRTLVFKFTDFIARLAPPITAPPAQAAS